MHRPTLRQCGPTLACCALLFCAAVFPFVPSLRAESHPVYANLLGRLDADHLADGDPFFAKISRDWKEGSCTLKAGTVLEGEVGHVQHRSKDSKYAGFNLRFHPIYCSGDEVHQFVPLLVAMDTPHHNDQDGNNSLASTTLANTFANMVASHTPMGSSGTAKPVGVPDEGIASAPGSMTGNDASDETLRVGEARGFSKVKLFLPQLVTDPTLLASSHSLLIDRDTRFALILRPIASEKEIAAASPPAPPAPAHSPAPKVATPSVPEPAVVGKEEPIVDICAETGCAVASNVAVTNTRLDRTVPLRTLGYRVRTNQVLRSLADDAAVAFLGRNQVLVTFNAHPLVKRSTAEIDGSTEPRVIRALLISATTGKVLRQQEWRIPERGPYLWALDQGRVLVRTGDAFTIFGPGLVARQQWTPPGSVRFVRISPSRTLIVVGVERERHTPQQHRMLAKFLGSDRSPEEDQDLTLLDEKLTVLNTQPISADVPMPAVLDSGVLLSDAGVRQKWVVQQLTWDHKKRTIVHVASSCPLRVETLPANLIVLTGCVADGKGYWYKVVRPDGKTLLTGTTTTEDWVEAADAPLGGKVFAIGIATASRPVDFDEGMITSDFQSVTVSIYRSEDGKRVFATRSSHGAVNRHSFALNEAGDRLAILSGDDLSFYRVQNEPAAAAEKPAVTARAAH